MEESIQTAIKELTEAVDRSVSVFTERSTRESMNARPEWALEDHFMQVAVETVMFRKVLMSMGQDSHANKAFQFIRENPEEMRRMSGLLRAAVGPGPFSLLWEKIQANPVAPGSQKE